MVCDVVRAEFNIIQLKTIIINIELKQYNVRRNKKSWKKAQ